MKYEINFNFNLILNHISYFPSSSKASFFLLNLFIFIHDMNPNTPNNIINPLITYCTYKKYPYPNTCTGVVFP